MQCPVSALEATQLITLKCFLKKLKLNGSRFYELRVFCIFQYDVPDSGSSRSNGRWLAFAPSALVGDIVSTIWGFWLASPS